MAPRDSGDFVAALIAFGEDLRLLRRRPRPASTRPGEHFQPTNRFRLRFGQKLSVRHVSSPLDSAGQTFADLLAALKVRSKGRLQCTDADGRFTSLGECAILRAWAAVRTPAIVKSLMNQASAAFRCRGLKMPS